MTALAHRECVHLNSPNPRQDGWCVKCGHRMPPAPVPPGTRPRDLDFEREITRHACRSVIDPAELIEFAEGRAHELSEEYVKRPSLVLSGRDRPRDAREELADARNHLVWHIEDHPDDLAVQDWLIALRHVALAYHVLSRD